MAHTLSFGVAVTTAFTVLATAFAKDVYVSSSTGSDASDGKTLATAWKTFAKVESVSLSTGDSVVLRAGDVWSDPLVLSGPGAGCHKGGMRGLLEAVVVNATSVFVEGWVVDPGLPNNGTPPVAIRVEVDGVGGLSCCTMLEHVILARSCTHTPLLIVHLRCPQSQIVSLFTRVAICESLSVETQTPPTSSHSTYHACSG